MKKKQKALSKKDKAMIKKMLMETAIHRLNEFPELSAGSAAKFICKWFKRLNQE